MLRQFLLNRLLTPCFIRRYTKTARMSLKVRIPMPYSTYWMLTTQAISSKDAAALDKDLMEEGGWSLDQLMELAGLSVSQAGK